MGLWWNRGLAGAQSRCSLRPTGHWAFGPAQRYLLNSTSKQMEMPCGLKRNVVWEHAFRLPKQAHGAQQTGMLGIMASII